MPISGDFQKILQSTTLLMNKAKDCPEEDQEELQMRIDSNIHALKILASKIDDPDTRNAFLKSIHSLRNDVVLIEESAMKKRDGNRPEMNSTGAIDEEILKNSRRLQEMANEFHDSLKTDQKILSNLSHKLTSNDQCTGKALNVLSKGRPPIKSSTFIFVAAMIFVVMYFITRFG